jgi:PadR family transcriptional regulator AphA
VEDRQSKLYEERKKLGPTAMAVPATTHRTSACSRRTITPMGRRALASGLSAPGDGPILECEQLAKIHAADSGTKADVVANLDAMRACGCAHLFWPRFGVVCSPVLAHPARVPG